MDGLGEVHVVYNNISGEIMYMKRSSGSWSSETISSGVIAWEVSPSVTVDGNGKAHVTYAQNNLSEPGNPGELTYATNSTGVWTEYAIKGHVDNITQSAAAIDPNGRMHVFYQDGDTIGYATNKSGVWASESLDRSMALGEGNSITLGPDGSAHIFYQEYNNDSLRYATSETGFWVATSIGQFGNGGDFTSSVTDSSGNLHVSHSSGGATKYSTDTGGPWQTETVPVSAPGYGTSIGVDSAGDVHMVTGNMKYATNSGGSWNVSSLDNSSANDFYQSLDLAVDGNDKLHIAYHATGKNLKYATNAQGFWTYTTIETESGNKDTGFSASIAVDGNNKVHIAYATVDDIEISQKLQYATNASGTWQVTTVDTDINYQPECDIAVSPDGKAHIAFGSLSGSLKFATNSGGSWAYETITEVSPVHYLSIALDTDGFAHIASDGGGIAYVTNRGRKLWAGVEPAGAATLSFSPTSLDGYYTDGTDVWVTATPEPGYTLSGWTGDASGASATVQVTMDADKSVTASLAGGRLLAVYADPPGYASFSFSPSHPGNYYADAEQVWVTVNPEPGWSFEGWTGDAAGTDNPLQLTMDADKSVTAGLRNGNRLSADSYPPDTATFVFSPVHPGNLYTPGEEVWVTVIPSSGNSFVNWSGDLSGSAAIGTLYMTSDKSVTANTSPVAYLHALTSPPELGTLSISPASAGNVYDIGETVWVTALPGIDVTFENWSSDATGTANPVQVTMDSHKTVFGVFSDTTGPTTVLTAPADGEFINGQLFNNYTIICTADDGNGYGVDYVEVSLNGGGNWLPTTQTDLPGGGRLYKYVWNLQDPEGMYSVIARARDLGSNPGPETVPVYVTLSRPQDHELTHYNWDYWLSGGDCSSCHHATQTFLSSGFINTEGLCLACHNPSAPGHERDIYIRGHGTMSNITTTGIAYPTYGNLTGEFDNRPKANLDGDMVTCTTCHNVMQKTEDTGRVWEMTTTPDNLTYTMQKGGWAAAGHYEPRVYRDTALWSGPVYVKDRKDYLVDQSEYAYDESTGTVTFQSAQDPTAYIYVTLYYPYLRAGSVANRLCSDCHPQQSHMGGNCLVCHRAHGAQNLDYIRSRIRLPNTSSAQTVFLNRTGPNSFADGDGMFDGVCEVCHTTTLYYRNDGSGFDNHSGGFDRDGADCTSCHTHISGFAK